MIPPLTEKIAGPRGEQISIRWHTSDVPSRDELLADLRRKLKLPRPPRPWWTRARYEAAGLAAIEEPDEHPAPASAKAVRHAVRIYYRSEGGELLAFHATGLTDAEATTLAAEHKGLWSRVEVSRGGRTWWEDRRPDVPDPQRWAQVADARGPALLGGARLVVLPSQQPAEVEVAACQD